MVKFSKKQLSKKQQRNKNKTTRKLKGGNFWVEKKSVKTAPATAAHTWDLPATASDDDGTVAATTPAKATATPALATWKLATTASDEDEDASSGGAFGGSSVLPAEGGSDEGGSGSSAKAPATPVPATDDGGSSSGGDGGSSASGSSDEGSSGSSGSDEIKCTASNINNKGKGGEVIFNTTSNELTVKPGSDEVKSTPTVLICGIKDGDFNLYYGSGSLPIVGGVGNITIPITDDTCKEFIKAILTRQQKIAEESQTEILDAIDNITMV